MLSSAATRQSNARSQEDRRSYTRLSLYFITYNHDMIDHHSLAAKPLICMPAAELEEDGQMKESQITLLLEKLRLSFLCLYFKL